MTEPPKPKEGDEICPMCRRPKSKHSPEELLACSRKMERQIVSLLPRTSKKI